jgi:hypothetical protein
MKMKPLKYISALVLALSLSASFSYAASTLKDQPDIQSFDYTTLKELDTQAEMLWKTIVQEKGSERAALEYIFLKNNNPDPRLVQLHSDVAQLTDSSYFEDAKVNKARLHISSLLRFVLINVSEFYGKEIRPNISIPFWYKNRDETAWKITGHLIWCAMDSKNELLFKKCSEGFGTEVYYDARKAGRASVLGYLYDGDIQTLTQGLSEQEIATMTEKNMKEICTTSTNITWLAFAVEYEEFALRNPFKSYRQAAFKAIVNRCYAGMNPEFRKYQRTLIPKGYQSLIDISGAYFGKYY